MRGAGALFAALLMAAACGVPASPVPVSSAAPSAAPTLTPTPTIDGSALARAAVAKLHADPFIAHIEQVAEGTALGQAVEAKVSCDLNGDDARCIVSAALPTGAVESGFVILGEEAWVSGDGVFTKVPLSAVQDAPAAYIKAIRITDDPSAFTYAGMEEIDGRDLHRLAAPSGQIPYVGANGATGVYDTLDLYVLADGTPVLLRAAYTGTDAASGITSSGTTTFELSSFGGPITIEAPSTSP